MPFHASLSSRRGNLRGIVGGICLALAAAIALASGLGYELSKPAKAGLATVVFRFDDFSALSEGDLEANLVGIFQRRRVPCTFGIIPCVGQHAETGQASHTYPLTEKQAGLILPAVRDGTISVALHGYSHQGTNGRATEFAGVSYQQQLDKLLLGRRRLEALFGCPVQCFIPPWNSYDAVTLKAMADLGFTCISASMSGVVDSAGQIKCLPATCSLMEFDSALTRARRSGGARPILVVLMHAYDFRESGDKRAYTTLDIVDALLETLKADGTLKFATVEQAAVGPDSPGASQAAANRYLHYLAKFVPPVIAARPSYFRSSLRTGDLAWIAVLAGAYYGAAGLGAYCLAGLMNRKVFWTFAAFLCAACGIPFVLHTVATSIWAIGTALCLLAGMMLGKAGYAALPNSSDGFST